MPLKIYESSQTAADVTEPGAFRFLSTGYSLATLEAERIGIDHVAKVVSGSSATSIESEVSRFLGPQRSALNILHRHILLIRNYVAAVKSGTVSPNRALLREIAGLCSRLPIDGDEQRFLKDSNDVLLVSYLATATKGLSAMNDMVDKFSVVHDNRIRRGRSWF